jgi:hypothetical protein
MKNVCLAIIALLLLVHMSCDACDVATAGECESCLNGEPTTLQVVIRDLSMGSLSGAAADLGLFDLADVLFKVEEVTSK